MNVKVLAANYSRVGRIGDNIYIAIIDTHEEGEGESKAYFYIEDKITYIDYFACIYKFAEVIPGIAAVLECKYTDDEIADESDTILILSNENGRSSELIDGKDGKIGYFELEGETVFYRDGEQMALLSKNSNGKYEIHDLNLSTLRHRGTLEQRRSRKLHEFLYGKRHDYAEKMIVEGAGKVWIEGIAETGRDFWVFRVCETLEIGKSIVKRKINALVDEPGMKEEDWNKLWGIVNNEGGNQVESNIRWAKEKQITLEKVDWLK
jgi:hypothetical protein